MNDFTASMRLFHPRGPQVTLPVVMGFNYSEAFAAVSAALDAGFQVEAPGLDEGEEKETVGWVLRGGSERDGQITPFVLLYTLNEALTWSFLKVYMNKPQDIEAFEYASKMKLEKLPDYVGNDKPQRGASQKTDKFIVKCPKPFGVVFKKNPKHDDTEAGKMKPARLFVRWELRKPDVQAAEKAATNGNGKVRTLPELVDYYENKAQDAGHKPGALTDFVLTKIGGNAHDWPETRREEVVNYVKEFAERKKQEAANMQHAQAYDEPDPNANIPF